MYKLNRLVMMNFDEIVILGRSIAGVDLPYFKYIVEITKKLKWKVSYYDKNEKVEIFETLKSQEISSRRKEMFHCSGFYDLFDDKKYKNFV